MNLIPESELDDKASGLLSAQDVILQECADQSRSQLSQAAQYWLHEVEPWRAAMLANIAWRCRVISRAQRDGIVREVGYVGQTGTLKRWDDRTNDEKLRGVRAPREVLE